MTDASPPPPSAEDGAEQPAAADAPERPAKRARVVTPIEVRRLVGLICDVESMRTAVKQAGYDLDTTPLDQLSKSTLREGFTWLKAIEQELAKPSPSERSLGILSSSFYRVMTLTESVDKSPIDSQEKIRAAVGLLELLLAVECMYVRLEKVLAGGGHRKIDPEELLEFMDGAEEVKSKRPQTPYFAWFTEHRLAIARLLGDGAKIHEIGRRGGELWKQMTDEQRAPYEEKYKAEKEEWDQEQNAIKARRKAAAEEADPLVLRQLRALGCELVPLVRGTNSWLLVYEYARLAAWPLSSIPRGVGPVLRVLRAHALDRPSEAKSFARHAKAPGRQLLWKAVPLTHWAALLASGAHAPPPEAPMGGGGALHFGRGIYFYDSAGEAAARAGLVPSTATSPVDAAAAPVLLLLAEVALGRSRELAHADPTAERLPTGFNSVIGRGRKGPNPARVRVTPEGASVPMGPLQDRPPPKVAASVPSGAVSLPCNEYVVYNPSQVKMRYLVEATWVDAAEAARLDSAAIIAAVQIPRRTRSKMPAPWEEFRSVSHLGCSPLPASRTQPSAELGVGVGE